MRYLIVWFFFITFSHDIRFWQKGDDTRVSALEWSTSFLNCVQSCQSKDQERMDGSESTCGRIRRDKAATWPISPVLNCGLNGCFAFYPRRLIYVREMPPSFYTLLAGWSSVLFSLRPQRRLSNLLCYLVKLLLQISLVVANFRNFRGKFLNENLYNVS